MTAITHDPKVCDGLPCVAGTTVAVASMLTELAKGACVEQLNDLGDCPQDLLSAALHQLAELYSHPPSPSIEAAAEEIYEATGPALRWQRDDLQTITEILARHFGTASRAERAWEIYQEHWQEWFIHHIAAGWEVGSGFKSLAIAPDPITAILRAAGEEGVDDGR